MQRASVLDDVADTIRFPRSGDDPVRPQTGTLADKLQRLVLRHPIAAKEIEKFIDRILASDPSEP